MRGILLLLWLSLALFSSLRVVSTQDCKGSWHSSLPPPVHQRFTRLVERVDFFC